MDFFKRKSKPQKLSTVKHEGLALYFEMERSAVGTKKQ